MQTAVEFRIRFRNVGEESILSQQMNHGHTAESATKPPKEFPPVYRPHVFRAKLDGALLRWANVVV